MPDEFPTATEPDAAAQRPDAPAVVFLNSGLLHRVGGSRMHVRMARRLAAQGYLCMRFDSAGLGDSDVRKDSLPFEKSGVIETREAMDVLATSRGSARFVLMGLCSGADMAYWTALDDDRVVGIFQLDPFDYRTRRYYLHVYGPKMLTLTPWLNMLRGRTYIGAWIRNRFAGRPPEAAEETGAEMVQSPYARAFPPRDEVARGLRVLRQRGVEIFSFFTGERDHSYQGQFKAAFRDVDLSKGFTEVYKGEADHLVTDLRLQEWLDGAFVSWLGTLSLR